MARLGSWSALERLRVSPHRHRIRRCRRDGARLGEPEGLLEGLHAGSLLSELCAADSYLNGLGFWVARLPLMPPFRATAAGCPANLSLQPCRSPPFNFCAGVTLNKIVLRFGIWVLCMAKSERIGLDYAQ
jgi:hypothetical protein